MGIVNYWFANACATMHSQKNTIIWCDCISLSNDKQGLIKALLNESCSFF